MHFTLTTLLVLLCVPQVPKVYWDLAPPRCWCWSTARACFCIGLSHNRC
jgi:hypothetical protein